MATDRSSTDKPCSRERWSGPHRSYRPPPGTVRRGHVCDLGPEIVSVDVASACSPNHAQVEMPWTWRQIEDEWLGESSIAHISEVIIDCFNEVERVLGAGWIGEQQGRGLSGSIPAASIVGVGQQLKSLQRVRNPAGLLARLRNKETSALAELAAIHSVIGATHDIEVELGPDVDVKGRPRKPDFRVHRDAEPWTYVEVSRPSTSEERRRLTAIMDRIVTLLSAVEGRYALEVYLRREPTAEELVEIIARGTQLCQQDGANTEELSNRLGLLLTNDTPIGIVSPKQRDVGDRRPIIGMSRGIVSNGVTQRHVVVRLAFSDQRADAFLKQEAQQLATDSPGLIVLETTETRGSESDWIELFTRRLHPQQHTRVGGIMLISGGVETTAGGAIWKQASRGIINPHAAHQLPQWVIDKVLAAN